MDFIVIWAASNTQNVASNECDNASKRVVEKNEVEFSPVGRRESKGFIELITD